jgi:YVTN family beta-propeller protein
MMAVEALQPAAGQPILDWAQTRQTEEEKMRTVAILASLAVLACAPRDAPPYKVYVTNAEAGIVVVAAPSPATIPRSIEVGDRPTYVSATHRGDLVFVSNSGDGTVSAISTEGDTVVGTIPVGGFLKGVEVAPGDRHVLVAVEDSGLVAVIDVRSLEVLKRMSVGAEPHNFAFDPDSNLGFVTCAGTDSVDIIDLGRLEKVGSIPAGSQPHNLVYVDGMLVVTSRDRPYVYFTDYGGLVDSVEVSEGHHGIAVGGQGKYVRAYVTGIGSDVVSVLDLARFEVVQRVPVGDGPHGIKTSPDNLFYFVAVPHRNWVRVISLAHGMTAYEIKGPGAPFWVAIARTPAQDPTFADVMHFKNVDARELQRMMAEEDLILVNVHEPYGGEIAGTDAYIPFDRISEYRELLPADQTARIVVYCRSGPMSRIAAQELVEAGYTNVCNLTDGYNHWKELDLPFEMREREE